MTIPENILGALQRYVSDGIEPGSCVRAILENNLTEAFVRADHQTTAAMHAIVAYIYNKMPMHCHGSPEKVDAWIASWRTGNVKP